MSEGKLHPSVIEFKKFINKYPSLRAEIRRSGRSWQEYYEKWALLGEDDEFWAPYKKEKEAKDTDGPNEKSPELFRQLMKVAEHMDINKIQSQVSQLNHSIAAVQEIIQQFQKSKHTPPRPRDPFDWFGD
ncbi:YlbD family protein [Virgibacillus xinjiangensis]|uniref:YlbD family protein n=1 Tax=Virgibacillus xinjiangensis TaxID=393090 RepID=A0ABV7CV23_9BACI